MSDMPDKQHWERVYTHQRADAVSWFQPHAGQSLQLIRDAGLARSAPIIDVGGGASTLVDDLLADGREALTVLDLSAAALATARARLGARAAAVQWLEANILDAPLPAQAYALWHDRAVFHFLTSPADRAAYVRAVLHAVKPGGHVIVATFDHDGPSQCSGLPVARYNADELHAEFGAPFTLLRHAQERHVTPAGAVQRFVYCFCRRAAS
jgi:SAM-dependent methyltransferase